MNKGKCERLPQGRQEVILDEVLCFHSNDSKTNRCIPFSLTKNYQFLEFACSYEPKSCDDMETAKQLIMAGLESYVPPEYREYCEPWEDFLPSVVNFITFSLDSPEKYLGCAHRHAPEQRHIISAGFSSPGFFRYAPNAGEWRAVLNVHAVVSTEVRYHFQILAHNEDY